MKLICLLSLVCLIGCSREPVYVCEICNDSGILECMHEKEACAACEGTGLSNVMVCVKCKGRGWKCIKCHNTDVIECKHRKEKL